MERLYLGITVTSTYTLVAMALILVFMRYGRLSWRQSRLYFRDPRVS